MSNYHAVPVKEIVTRLFEENTLVSIRPYDAHSFGTVLEFDESREGKWDSFAWASILPHLACAYTIVYDMRGFCVIQIATNIATQQGVYAKFMKGR